MYKEIEGDLIQLSLEGNFDVITHGCNCFCNMGAGIAPKMAEVFSCDTFDKEVIEYTDYDEDNKKYVVKTNNKGDINKLGNIDYRHEYLWFKHPNAINGLAKAMGYKTKGQSDVKDLIVVNSYTQYHYGKGLQLDYESLTLCLRKINSIFKGKHIGLPKIGCGLAGGDWNIVKSIIQKELKDCDTTVVIWK